MVKEKWQKLVFREKLLLASGVTVLLSIPLALVMTSVLLLFSVTFFVGAVFYNLYDFVKTINKPLQIKTLTSTKGAPEISQTCKLSIGSIFAPLVVGIGTPFTVIMLTYTWLEFFCHM